MIVPLEWLKEYTDINVSQDEYLSKMIMMGIGVESVEELGAELNGVIVGKIISMEKHPDADRLKICMLDVGAEEQLQIITAAPNVSEGDTVPVATHGTKLPSGMVIKKGKMRGVVSNGMLCGGEELDLTDDDCEGASIDGVLILPNEIVPGTSLAEALKIGGVVVDFEVYANRPDRQSIIGMARETAATLETELRLPEIRVDKTIDDKMPISVSVQDTELCPRYIARVVKNVKIEPSPAWMQKCLKQAGVRPINNIVDITNYVMLEMGQPMHAFDLACVGGNQIIVRKATEGETLMTLDEKERKLEAGMLVIADSKKPIGVAGVMGGGNSDITDQTKDIVLESASFLPSSVRATSKALGLSTESSARFVKGVDASGTEKAMDRAAQLIVMLNAGDVINEKIDICSQLETNRKAEAGVKSINDLLGLKLSASEIVALLNRAFIPSEVKDEDTVVCNVPDYRRDIEITVDVAEEVARMYGYENIPMSLMRGGLMVGALSESDAQGDRAKNRLCSLGFFEAQTYSFIGPREYDALGLGEDDDLRKCVPLFNPFGEDQSLMRTTMVPGLLRTVSLNAARKNTNVCLFEVGAVFIPKALPLTELPNEKQMLGLAMYGDGFDFFTLKGAIESVARCLNIQGMNFEVGGPEYLHPGQKAIVMIGKKQIGYIGCLHPDIADNFELEAGVLVGEIDWTKLIDSASNDTIKAYALPKYPSVERDLALVMDIDQPAGDLVEMMKKAGGALIESAVPFDVFVGKQVGENKKSVAYSLVFRASDRTLTDEEISPVIKKIVKNAGKRFGAELR